MSKNTNIADLINYISVDGSGNVVLSTGQLVATQNYVTTAVSNLVASAPSTLDTLNELATALGNDANFATTVATSIGTKLNLSGGTLTGALSGTSATFSSTLAAMGSNIQFNLDGTFGANYYTMGFGGVSNGFNRIAAGTGTTDGLYILAATGRDIVFRTNGSGSNTLVLASTGAATFSNSFTTSDTAAFFLSPSLSANNTTFLQLGKNIADTYNSGEMSFKFVASGSSSNMVSLGFYGAGNKLNVLGNGNVGIGFTNATSKLQVAGEITTYAGTNTSYYAYMNYLGTTYNFGPGEATDNVDFKIAGGGTFTTGGGFRFFTQPGSTTPVERMRITSGGLLQLINSTGIRFAAGASNLNYYQEGSWTPQLYAGSTAFTMSGINDGRYVRVGNQVTISGHLQWSGGSGTGMVRISGLPFTCSGVRSAGSMGAVSYGISFSSGYNHWILVVDPGTDYIYIIQGDSTGGGYSHNPPVGSSGVIYGFSITYHTL